MPTQGEHDQFELHYMARLRALLTTAGVPVDYDQDRAALDTGLHLFVQRDGTDWSASQVRVWFQVKGKRALTLPADTFRTSDTVAVKVQVAHLRFWYAAPEPVYLVVFVESAGVFIAEDVLPLVDRTWPDHDFYSATVEQAEATVQLRSTAILDENRITAMLSHRSMRIDGATFQGRPLGHRFDPLRSELIFNDAPLWESAVRRLLAEHRLQEHSPPVAVFPDLTVLRGRFYDTMVWQSGAFAEFGQGPDDDFRDDPAVESVQGPARVIVDSRLDRTDLSPAERDGMLRTKRSLAR